MNNSHRIYSIALATLGACAATSSALLFYLAGASAGGAVATHLPEESLPWIATLNFAYTVAIIATLCARRFKPETGRKLTRVLNWALLPAVPGGTIVGLYGLWQADKKQSEHKA